jgi:hypothetical protein
VDVEDRVADTLTEPLPLGDSVEDTQDVELLEGDVENDPVPEEQGEGECEVESDGETEPVRVTDRLPLGHAVDVPDTLPLGVGLPLGVRVVLPHRDGEAEREADGLPDTLPDTDPVKLPPPVLLYPGLEEAHTVGL